MGFLLCFFFLEIDRVISTLHCIIYNTNAADKIAPIVHVVHTLSLWRRHVISSWLHAADADKYLITHKIETVIPWYRRWQPDETFQCSHTLFWHNNHYGDVIMGAIASQITSLTSVYAILYSDEDQRKDQSSESLASVRGIHRGPVNSPHKWPVRRKKFPFDDVIMPCLFYLIDDYLMTWKPFCIAGSLWGESAGHRLMVDSTHKWPVKRSLYVPFIVSLENGWKNSHGNISWDAMTFMRLHFNAK